MSNEQNYLRQWQQLLLLALCAIPLLVSHRAEWILWRVELDAFILNTAKVELLLVDIALLIMGIAIGGLIILGNTSHFIQYAKQIIFNYGGIWWVLLAIWSFVSVIWSIETGLTLYRSVHFALGLLIAFLTAFAVWHSAGKWLLGALLVAAFLQSGVAIAQYINDAPLGLSMAGELQQAPNLAFAEESTRLRAYGLSLHPNILAGFLMIAVLLGFLRMMDTSTLTTSTTALVMMLGLFAILATGSRLILLLTFGLGGLLLMLRLKLRPVAVISVGLVGMLIGAVALQLLFPNLWERLTELHSLDGLIDRMTFAFVNTLPIIQENPILGVGNGAAIVAIGQEWHGSDVLLLPAHNAYIHLWSELGIVGTALFVMGLISTVNLAHPQNGQRVVIIGLALVGVMIIMLFDYYFWGEPRSQWLLLWLVGIMWGYASRADVDTESDSQYTTKLMTFRESLTVSNDTPSVTVQIVTFNNEDTIAPCLESVNAQTYAHIHVVIIDNASQDATCNIIKKCNYNVHKNMSNTGYAAAHNQALKLSESDYVLTLNPDAILKPDFIKHMVKQLQATPTIGMASGLLLRVETLTAAPTIIDGAGIYIERTARQRLRFEGQSISKMPATAPIFGSDGAAAFYRRNMLNDLALDGEIFDEDFFMHKEDVDLCWRAQLYGWDAVCVSGAIAHHIRGFRPGQRQTISSDVRFWALRNRYLNLIKNADIENILRDFPYLIGYEILILGYLLLRERENLTAYLGAWRLRKRMVAKRRLIQQCRRRSPQAIRYILQLS